MRFLKFFIAVLILLSSHFSLFAQSPRQKINFDNDWKFHLGDVNGAQFSSFDDGNWRSLDVPHDWSIEQPFSANNASGQAYLPGGIGWYRKSFTLPGKYDGNEIKILFDGVYQNAEVWINGHYLGKRPYGFISFRRDLTSYIHFGNQPNVLAVRVDHSHDADSRWYTGSGIIRNVWLNIMNPVHIAGWGTAVSTPEVSKNSARVNVSTAIVNDTDSDRKITLRNVIMDSVGNSFKSSESVVQIPAHSQRKVEQKIDVENPALWSPAHPALYKIQSSVQYDDQKVDEKNIPFGIRTFRFDAQKGFFLNGRSMLIKGVCLHNDAGALGSAVPKSEWQRRLELMKEMGANAIRTSHNPPAPELLDLADKMGFLVMDEAFDEWKLGKKKWIHGRNVGQDLGAAGLEKYYSQHGYSDFFKDWAKKDVQDMVRRDRNHPSIFLWSIGNEIDYPNDPYTDPYRDDYQKWRPTGYHLTEIARHLYDDVKAIDTTRPVTAAIANAPLANKTGYGSVMDVAGYNYQEQHYEDDHKKFPDRKITGSENGDSYEAWMAVKNNDFIPGQFLWTGVDYLGEAGRFPNRSNAAGLVTLDDYRKSDFYFRQSLWTDKPMVHLAAIDPNADNRWSHAYSSWNWGSSEGKSVKVVVYTNCESVELFLNGESLGTKKMDKAEHHVLSWNVPYQEGTLKAVAKNDGREVASYILKTAGKPYKILLKEDGDSIKKDAGVASVKVLVTDRDGNIVPNADNLVHFSVEGPGKNIGVGNANHNNTESYKSDQRKVYHGRARIFIQSTCTDSTIKLKATTKNLKSGELNIKIQ